jgi:hypothetical protein
MRPSIKYRLMYFFFFASILFQTNIYAEPIAPSSETLTEKHYLDFEAFVNKLDKSDLKARDKMIEYYLPNIDSPTRKFREERYKVGDYDLKEPVADKCRKLYEETYFAIFNAQYDRMQKQRDEDRKTTPSLSVVFNPLELIYLTDSPVPPCKTKEQGETSSANAENPTPPWENPAFASEPFGAYLKKLNPADFHDVTAALEHYKTTFADKPEKEKLSAFRKLQVFVEEYGDAMDSVLANHLYAILQDADYPTNRLTSLERERYEMDRHVLVYDRHILEKFALHLRGDEDSAWETVEIRPALYVRGVGGILPPYLRDYLALEDEEMADPIGHGDGNTVYSEADFCGERAREWEVYLKNYPNSEYKEQAANNFNVAWHCFLRRDNWDEKTKVLSPKTQTAYEKYAQKYKDAPTGKQVQKIYDILKSKNFKWDESFRERYKEVLGFEACGPYPTDEMLRTQF